MQVVRATMPESFDLRPQHGIEQSRPGMTPLQHLGTPRRVSAVCAPRAVRLENWGDLPRGETP